MLGGSEAEQRGKVKKGGIERVLSKLHLSLDRKDYYEAHQMYRTLAFRYSGQNKSSDALELLFDGALRLLDCGQKSSGADLALLFVEHLYEANIPPSETWLLKLEQLFARLPSSAATEKNEGRLDQSAAAFVDRTKFMDTAMKWARSVGTNPEEKKKGHPGVHGKFATVLWGEQKFPQARYHFMLSEEGEACASFLVEYHMKSGYASEVDLFLAQAVLQFLCHQKKTVANTLFAQYTLKHPHIMGSGPPFGLPLINFLWLLLLAVDLRRIQHFTILIDEYKPSIDRDPSYVDYLQKIGQIWFGLPSTPKPTQRPGGFIANLFQGLLAPDSDEEEEDGTYGGLGPANGPSSANPQETMKEETELD